MYRITVLGEIPADRKTLLAVLTELSQQCRLEFFRHLVTDPTGGWSGPLLDAPVGVYDLWQESGHGHQGFYLAQLIVSPTHVLLNDKVVDLAFRAIAVQRLPEHVRTSFHQLFQGTEKLLWVYQQGDDVVGREYQMLWPGDPPPAEHPDYPGFDLIGQANLQTGVID